MREELKPILAQARTVAPDELPRLLGDLEEVRATCLARLTSPVIEERPDRSLDVTQAAERMGVSKDYLYHHWQELKFARQEGRKVLFSSNGLDAHLRKSR